MITSNGFSYDTIGSIQILTSRPKPAATCDQYILN